MGYIVIIVVAFFVKKFVFRPSSLEWENGRRKAFQLCVKDQSYYKEKGVETREKYIINKRGIEILTKQWLPLNIIPKGIIFYCHGYSDTCCYFFDDVATKLAASNYAVVGMDFEGHGRSQGLHAYIPRFDNLCDDIIELSYTIKEMQEFKSLPSFVYGESMGGAVAIKTCLSENNLWNGAILLAPMCKIADEMLPHPIVTKILIFLSRFFPKFKGGPNNDIGGMAFRVPEKKDKAHNNPVSYKDPVRLGTAVEMLNATQFIDANLHKVAHPLLILHGEKDIVTDPNSSKELYTKASSKDKTIIIYENSWHALTAGEPDDVVEIVMGDIINWLEGHSSKAKVDLVAADRSCIGQF